MKYLPAFRAILLVIACFMFNLSVYPNDKSSVRDSLSNIISNTTGEDKLKAYQKIVFQYDIDEEGDELLRMYDEYIAEARKEKDLNHENHARINKLNQLFNLNRWDEFMEEVHPSLEFAKEQGFWHTYYLAYQTLLEVFLIQGAYEKAIDGANELYEVAKNNEHTPGMAVASYSIALAYQQTNRWEDAELYYRRAIELEKELKVALRHTMFDAYYGLCEVLSEQKKYDEAFLFLAEWEKNLKEKDEAVEMSNKVAWYGYYIVSARVYTESGRYAEAEKYCDLAENELPGVERALINVHYYRSRVYEAYGMPEKAVAELEKTQLYCLNAGETNFLQEVLTAKLRILAQMSGREEIPVLVESIMHLKDSIRRIDIEARLDELRTVYEVDKLTAEKEIHRQRWIIGIVACCLLLVALLIYMVYSRRLKNRNRLLYEQIGELSRKEKAVESCFLSKPVETLSKEMLLYRQLSERMKAEKLFTDSDLNRKILADRLGTNESYLATAIRQGSGDTFSDYLSNLRLNYALELLNDYPEITLEAVAIDSGHGSYSQFFRSFSKKYGINPSEYRKLSMQKEK